MQVRYTSYQEDQVFLSFSNRLALTSYESMYSKSDKILYNLLLS